MWTPPPGVTDHQGDALAPDRDFFVAPPLDIGNVRTAHTSLKQGVGAKPVLARVAIALAWGALGFVVAMGIQRFTALLYIPSGMTGTPIYLWEALIGLLPAWIAWRKTRFHHFCHYVGDRGCAQLKCEGERGNIVQNSVFAFKDAVSLSTSIIRHVKNGRYNYTNFYFSWHSSASDKPVYQISGSHSADAKQPPAGNPYNFARAAESAWYNYVTPAVQAELAQKGLVRFYMGRNRWTVLGNGFMEIVDKDGKVSRCDAADVGSARLDAGYLTIARKGATPSRFDLFSKEGVFRFDYAVIHNARLFVYFFERCMGMRVA